MEGARNFETPQSLQIEQISSQYSNSPASQDIQPSLTQEDHSDSFQTSNRMTETVQTLVTTPQKQNQENVAPLIPEDDSPAQRVSYVPKNNFTLKIPQFARMNEFTAARSHRQEEAKRKKKKLFQTEFIPSSRDLAKFRAHKFKVVVPRAANQQYEKYIPPATQTKQYEEIEAKAAKIPLITELAQDIKLKRQKQLQIQLHNEIRAEMIETPPDSDYEQASQRGNYSSQESKGLILHSEIQEEKSECEYESERETPEPGEISNSLQSKPSSDWLKTSTLELQTSLLQHRYYSQTSNSQESSNLFKSPKNKRKQRKVEEEYQLEENIPEYQYGRLHYGDIPRKVLTIYRRAQQLMLVVDWERRAHDGFKPHISEVFSDEFKMDFPLKLIEFYQSQTRFETKVLSEGNGNLPLYAMRSRT